MLASLENFSAITSLVGCTDSIVPIHFAKTKWYTLSYLFLRAGFRCEFELVLLRCSNCVPTAWSDDGTDCRTRARTNRSTRSFLSDPTIWASKKISWKDAKMNAVKKISPRSSLFSLPPFIPLYPAGNIIRAPIAFAPPLIFAQWFRTLLKLDKNIHPSHEFRSELACEWTSERCKQVAHY